MSLPSPAEARTAFQIAFEHLILVAATHTPSQQAWMKSFRAAEQLNEAAIEITGRPLDWPPAVLAAKRRARG